jgi:hypothetical protein
MANFDYLDRVAGTSKLICNPKRARVVYVHKPSGAPAV